MKRMYHIGLGHFETPILRVDVVRVTDRSVWVRGRRRPEKRSSRDGRFFESWSDAYVYLVNNAKNALRNARQEVRDAKAELDTVLALRPPADEE